MQPEVKAKKCVGAIFLERPQTTAIAGVASMHNAYVLDWPAIRGELRRLRAEHDLTREELQKLSGVEKTTIYRIENTKELPDYKPDFDTISALLVAMEMTLSGFFARIEDPTATVAVEHRGPSDVAQDLAAAIDRLIVARVAAPTRPAAATADGATVTLTLSAPLEDWQVESLREYGETLATGEAPESAASPARPRQAPTDKQEKPA